MIWRRAKFDKGTQGYVHEKQGYKATWDLVDDDWVIQGFCLGNQTGWNPGTLTAKAPETKSLIQAMRSVEKLLGLDEVEIAFEKKKTKVKLAKSST